MKTILTFMIVLTFPLSAVSGTFNGIVVKVLDGDTIDVLHEKKPVRVRLANIDAPEKKQAYGRWSAEQLKSLVAGKSVKVTYNSTDRYGRVLGVVETQYINANRSQVISGAAWVYERYNQDELLPALQQEAQKHKRGLWAVNQPVPPWEWRKINN